MLTNFDFYTNSSNAVMNVNIGVPRVYGYLSLAPMQGTGSLQCEFLTNSLKGNVRPGSSLVRGTTNGLIITQVYATEQNTGAYAFGLYCMGSNADLSSGIGNCYIFSFEKTTTVYSAKIKKSTSGIGLSAFQALSAVSAAAWAPNTSFFIALSWVVSGSTITLVGKKGFLADYSDLSTIVSVVDSTSAFTSQSVGEGLWADSSTNNRFRVQFDQSLWAGRV